MTDGTPISGLGPHHGRRQQEIIAIQGSTNGRSQPEQRTGAEDRWTRLSIASPSSTYSRHRVAASGLAADPTTASESALPLNHPTRRPWVAIARGRGFGRPRPLPHNPATPHPARPRRSLQPRAQIAPGSVLADRAAEAVVMCVLYPALYAGSVSRGRRFG